MAFDLNGLSQVQALGNGKRYLAYDTADSLATVLTGGYFYAARTAMGGGDRLDIVAAGERLDAYVAVVGSFGVNVVASQGPYGTAVNIRAFGAVGDGVVAASRGSMTSASATLTLSSLPAGARKGRVGDLVAVPGAGVAGVMLVATILTAAASGLSYTLSVAASTTVASVDVAYGTNDTAAWKAAAAGAIDTLRPLYIPSGIYMIAAGAAVAGPGVTVNACHRAGGWGVFGDGLYRSVIFNASTDYALELTSGCDGLSFRQFSVKTWGLGGGGGIKTMEGGNQVYEEFFMDGCGSSKWGIYNQDGYAVTVKDCRFWHEANEFRGGWMFHNSGHSLRMDNNFCSRLSKDGTGIYIADYKGVIIPNITCESNAWSLGARLDNQIYIEFGNNCFGVEIGHIHAEGAGWKYVIRNVDGTRIDSMKIGSIYAWQKYASTFSQPDHTVVKLEASDVAHIGKIVLKVDDEEGFAVGAPTTLATAYIVDDPGHQSTIDEVRLIGDDTVGRPWAQWYQPKGKTVLFAGSTTTAVTTTLQLTAGPGSYRVTLDFMKGTVLVPEGNHGRGRSYIVTWDDGSVSDYTSVRPNTDAEWSKGSNFPNALVVTVDNTGLITAGTTANTSINAICFASWDKQTDLRL